MIKVPTTFVLGAGSNVDYGFPTGFKLKQEICVRLSPPIVRGDSQWYNILKECGFDENEMESFRNSFFGSPIPTIDEYMHINRHFNKIAKYAIALELISHENDAVFNGGDPTTSWYHNLFNLMMDGPNWENFSSNSVSFVTYNYDRSLEHFFYKSLKATYTKVSQEELFGIMKKLNIVHVHGKLGSLPWEGKKDLRNYSNAIDRDNLDKASKSIITINETDEGTKEYVKAREMIANSNKVIFLGFGFHEYNLKRLNANTCLQEKDISGTLREKSPEQMTEIMNILQNISISNLKSTNCADFMNTHKFD